MIGLSGVERPGFQHAKNTSKAVQGGGPRRSKEVQGGGVVKQTCETHPRRSKAVQGGGPRQSKEVQGVCSSQLGGGSRA